MIFSLSISASKSADRDDLSSSDRILLVNFYDVAKVLCLLSNAKRFRSLLVVVSMVE